MKKLISILVFAGLLGVPSAVFAEASWYGSLRGGVEFGGGSTKFYDGASRWGIKGSAEAGEGLTAVYRFEHKFSTSDAGQAGGRLAYVGLSGGFGALTLGQIWSASYNHAGVIRDFPNWYTSPDTSARVGNALSYALSNDVFSMQIDAIMDGKKDSGKAVDQLEFGLTVNVGEIGKVAFSHVNVQDHSVHKTVLESTSSSVTSLTADVNSTFQGTVSTTIAGNIDADYNQPTLEGGITAALTVGAPMYSPLAADQVAQVQCHNGTSEGTYAITECMDNPVNLDDQDDNDVDPFAGDYSIERTYDTSGNEIMVADPTVNIVLNRTPNALSNAQLTIPATAIENLRHEDAEGNPVMQRFVLRVLATDGSAEDLATSDDSGNDNRCTTAPGATPPRCTEIVQYFTSADDGTVNVVADPNTLVHRADYNLGRGTLEIVGGELTLTHNLALEDGMVTGEVTSTLENVEIETITTTMTEEKTKAETVDGHRSSHISTEFGVGGLTAALGYSEHKVNRASGKTKTTFVGAKGSLGDTGLNWGAYSRSIKKPDGSKTSPWTIGVSRSLGDSAWTYVEHGNDGNDGSTVVGLGINF